MNTHYHKPTGRWFTPERCENCDSEIQAANAITLAAPEVDLPKLLAMGVQLVDVLPPEGEWNDELGCEVCPNCRP